jgi:hypothetical protein
VNDYQNARFDPSVLLGLGEKENRKEENSFYGSVFAS